MEIRWGAPPAPEVSIETMDYFRERRMHLVSETSFGEDSYDNAGFYRWIGWRRFGRCMGKWQARAYQGQVGWEGPLYDDPILAYVNACIENWGQP